MKKQIGKNTIGGGGKMGVNLRTYERSTHDLSYIWRSTMAPGVLVPFMKLWTLRGDTFDINLEADVMTHPTTGPLFGSFKLQLDVFTADVRLYQGKLHNNTLNIGLAMNTVKLPILRMPVGAFNVNLPPDTQQINPSCIYSYLGIRGCAGYTPTAFTRDFNAVPTLAYAEIYKNYYANKQETNGQMIHNASVLKTITSMTVNIGAGNVTVYTPASGAAANQILNTTCTMAINYTGVRPNIQEVLLKLYDGSLYGDIPIENVFDQITDGAGTIAFGIIKDEFIGLELKWYEYADPINDQEPKILSFPLANIDLMREDIMAATKITTPFIIDQNTYAPYGQPMHFDGLVYSKQTALEGLFLKTYQSDVFNNWVKTASITGSGSINDITKIDTSGGSFTIDTLTFKRKVYNMLNAVALSGGSYDDWQDVNWQEESQGKPEIPVYHGGLSKEVIFQEVVSNSAGGDDQPLGTLAGRGKLGSKHKGGYVRISTKEAGVIMGIVSLTPRIDYSQGNDWDVNIMTMDDFHKPALDGIGFQDLITDQMAYWDTGAGVEGLIFRSAGKQPAWINYMTNYNKCYGNFAIESQEMFMTLNRRYQLDKATVRIKDLTTYIDPSNYNHIFAYTKRDAQNFWVQIGVNIEARRKMSAKIMPQG